MSVQDYVNSIQKSFKEVGTQLILRALILRFPWMGGALVNPLVGLLVGYIVGILATELEKSSFFIYTDFRVDSQGRNFLEYAKRYKEAMDGTDLHKQKSARDGLIRAFDKFVSLRS